MTGSTSRAATAAFLLFATIDCNAASAVWYQSMPGDTVGQGQTRLYQDPSELVFTGNSAPDSVFTVYHLGGLMTLGLRPRPGEALAPGAYEMAAHYLHSGRSPGLWFVASTPTCNQTVSGRFTVLEAAYGEDGHPISFAANLEQYCASSTAPLYAEVRINSLLPLTIDKVPGSTTPDPFAFLPRTIVPLSSAVVSNPITIYGVNAPAPISISGGEYSVNGGPFTSDAGTVVNRDRVRVRLTSAATGGTTRTATLTAGGVSASFDVTTFMAGAPITAILLDSAPGDLIGGGQSLLGVAPDWTISGSVSPFSAFMQIDGPAGQWYWLQLAPNVPDELRLGPYEEAGATGFQGRSPGLSLSGWSGGCPGSRGRFVLLDLAATGNVVDRLAVNFEQRCNGGPPLYGELRLNSAVPLSFMVPSPDTVPDAFALEAQTPVAAGATVTSNVFSVYGIDVPVPIAVTGGTYSVNGGPFTAAAGTVNELDQVVVRMTASSVPGALNRATLKVGDLPEVPFEVTTYQPGEMLTGLYFRSSGNDPIGQGGTRLYLNPRDHLFAIPPYGLNTVAAILDGRGGGRFTLNVGAPWPSALTVGTYEGATDYALRGETHHGVNFQGNSLACTVAPNARLVVHEINIVGNNLQSFAADWEQRCEGYTGTLVGEIRFRSSVPFSALAGTEPPPLLRRPRDMNGNGTSDIVIRDTSSGTHYGWLMNGTSVASGAYILDAGSGWEVVQVADFNGDGKADLLIRHTDGSVYMRLMDGLDVIGGGFVLGAGTDFTVSHVADFNGDGLADLLLRSTSGAIYIQTMNGFTPLAGTYLQGGGSLWAVSHVADFNGDGKADIVMKHLDGSMYAYLMDGISILGGTYLLGSDSGWAPTATGDFNGDGKADILITHTNGGVYLWQMNGLAIATGTYLQSPGTGWAIDRTADLDGDGKSDIVIKHADGSYYAWIMNGLGVTNGGYLLGAGTGWSVSHALDLNGDGKSDLLIKHADGSIYGWIMDGPTVTGGAYLMGAGPWRVTP